MKCLYDDCPGEVAIRPARGHDEAHCTSCMRSIPIWLMANTIDRLRSALPAPSESAKGEPDAVCPMCSGAGKVTNVASFDSLPEAFDAVLGHLQSIGKEPCETCEGTGEIAIDTSNENEMHVDSEDCHDCQGTGEDPTR
jgi:DnaJ-class molecular chaperone